MRRHWWGAGIGLLLLAVLLAGCGATRVGAERAVHTKPTPTPTATPTPTPTPSPTAVPAPCEGGTAILYEGDLEIALLPVDFGFGYPGRKLPDGLALKPYQLPAAPGPALDQQLPLAPAVNPGLDEPGAGYGLLICNTSKSQSHTISGVSLKIANVTPYSGQLNEWMSGGSTCANYFVPPRGVAGGGCGGAYSDYANCVHATFPATATAGAAVAALPSTKCTANIPLPKALGPQQTFTVTLGVTPPTTPGTYSFAFGVTMDGGAIFSPGQEPTLLAPIAHKWSGEACTASAMQAQIPTATTPPSYYICPEA